MYSNKTHLSQGHHLSWSHVREMSQQIGILLAAQDIQTEQNWLFWGCDIVLANKICSKALLHHTKMSSSVGLMLSGNGFIPHRGEHKHVNISWLQQLLCGQLQVHLLQERPSREKCCKEACCDDDARSDDMHPFIWGRHNPTGQVQEASASSEWVGLLQPGSRGKNNSGQVDNVLKNIIKHTLSSSHSFYWIILDTAPESLLWTEEAIIVRLTGTMWANIVSQWVCQYSFITLHQMTVPLTVPLQS